ncbi:hypothetical protein RhiirB3_432463 [Rhizophagus irregularis]|nr:hypothetical protein RhiirB3_432463 [Rhizophagus irregularis]
MLKVLLKHFTYLFFKYWCKIRDTFELFYDQLEYNKLEPSIYTMEFNLYMGIY